MAAVRARLLGLVGAWCLFGAAAAAQPLPSEPVSVGDGRLTISGDVSASYGSSDPGFFNYTDYDHSALRMFRVDVAGALRANDHFSVLGEIRTENVDTLQPYALYLRIKPWTTKDFDVQVGRVPPTFGAFARRTYVSDNLLIGYPLAYQYLTSLRPDALPASADELLQKRSFGWLVRYSRGSETQDHGVPLVTAFKWDTGVQVHAAKGVLNGTIAVTAGTLSNPVFHDDNSGKQLAGRVEARPITGLVLGASAARGPFVSDAAARSVTGSTSTSDFTQTAWGADAEYSKGYYLVRAEMIRSDWRLPLDHPAGSVLPLHAVSGSLEGRYKVTPGFYVAGRVDHIGFSDIAGTTATLPWDAPVSRIEAGGGYSIQRNVLLKASWQHDRRDGGRLKSSDSQTAIQIVYWF